MVIYYSIVFFVIGLFLGSFYNVVGDRLPNDESIIKPRSHCENCGHILSWYELIPILSFIFLKGKCKNCGKKISLFHPFVELLTGILFMVSFAVFAWSWQFLIAITFISILIIVIVSDYHYMIICDEVLIIGNILLTIELILMQGINSTILSIGSGLIAFLIMYLIKLFGDFIFQRESMGGGDIKLMFTFGLVLGVLNSIVALFLASMIGLPISIILLKYYKDREVPFGPFLSLAAIIILLTQFDYFSLL